MCANRRQEHHDQDQDVDDEGGDRIQGKIFTMTDTTTFQGKKWNAEEDSGSLGGHGEMLLGVESSSTMGTKTKERCSNHFITEEN